MHIIGAGGHAKVIIEIIKQNGLEIAGVWAESWNEPIFLSYPVKDLGAFARQGNSEFIIAIGNNQTRMRISQQLVPTTALAIHPSCVMSKSASIGGGTVCMANTSINANAIIGNHVIINTNASVDHDCRIGDYVHISPQVGIAGNVEIDEGTHVGIGANIIQGVKIGKWVTIGAGAVVINDVPDYAVLVGNPGRIIKYNRQN
jgi:sugar O-acyltransferase (sialic acid O-acetyltransferase NeuD family)